MVKKAFFLGVALFVLGIPVAQAQEGDNDVVKLLTPKISEDLHQNFLDFDRNRDGFITFAEFAYAYPRYYTTGDNHSPLSQHFAAMDTDANSVISEDEFIVGHAAPINKENYTMKWTPNGHNDFGN